MRVGEQEHPHHAATAAGRLSGCAGRGRAPPRSRRRAPRGAAPPSGRS
jgi:hypothetical protein